jgi:Raf kinase inhibitor-like YbhB/YbcL family protein
MIRCIIGHSRRWWSSLSCRTKEFEGFAWYGRVFVMFLIVFMPMELNGKTQEETMTFTLHSDAFDSMMEIPGKYTCQGRNVSPPLRWQGVPVGTRSLVLIVDDPDAPDPRAPKMTWVHWVLFNLPPETEGLPEAVDAGQLPPGTRQGLNDWKQTGYGGPCPPVGRHRYFHKLYALDIELDLSGKPTKTTLEVAMQGHVIAKAELVGTYQKTR